MSVRDFFKVVLKVLALFLITNAIIPLIPSAFAYWDSDISSSLFLIGSILVYVIICILLLFYSDAIIDKLALIKNFNSSQFNFKNLNKEILLETSFILIGLYIIISSLPVLMQEGFLFFKSHAQNSGLYEILGSNEYYFYNQLIYFFLGLTFLSLRKQLIKFFT